MPVRYSSIACRCTRGNCWLDSPTVLRPCKPARVISNMGVHLAAAQVLHQQVRLQELLANVAEADLGQRRFADLWR